jgi:hypothetical protein
MLSLVFYRVIKAASIAEKNFITRDLYFYAFLKGEIPYILVFEYNIFQHTSYFNFDVTAKLNPASNVVMLQCKTTHNKNQYS